MSYFIYLVNTYDQVYLPTRPKKYPKHRNMKMFAVLQISFLAQEQRACSHILLQHRAYLGTVGKAKKKLKKSGGKDKTRQLYYILHIIQ